MEPQSLKEDGEVDEVEEIVGKQSPAPADESDVASNFIADIKNAAQEAQNSMGFIYEPTSGLYYDSRTGYYYNAVIGSGAMKSNRWIYRWFFSHNLQEHGLYYDGNNGCYYSYNQKENKFEFHSQAYADNTETVAKEESKQVIRVGAWVQLMKFIHDKSFPIVRFLLIIYCTDFRTLKLIAIDRMRWVGVISWYVQWKWVFVFLIADQRWRRAR